ncbi:TPA: hypothetical protein ACWOSI_001266 [Salmonella enterica subsp. enterica]|nr:hypothetical protein [Salmonella enterica subsp. enterica serovar Mikawasima]
MKKRLIKKEMIEEMVEKRNSDLELNKRLRRMWLLSLNLSCALGKEPAIADHIYGCLEGVFSYLADDAHYVLAELSNRKWGGVKGWYENQKDIAENYK